jgi:hypothetical protein
MSVPLKLQPQVLGAGDVEDLEDDFVLFEFQRRCATTVSGQSGVVFVNICSRISVEFFLFSLRTGRTAAMARHGRLPESSPVSDRPASGRRWCRWRIGNAVDARALGAFHQHLDGTVGSFNICRMLATQPIS